MKTIYKDMTDRWGFIDGKANYLKKHNLLIIHHFTINKSTEIYTKEVYRAGHQLAMLVC